MSALMLDDENKRKIKSLKERVIFSINLMAFITLLHGIMLFMLCETEDKKTWVDMKHPELPTLWFERLWNINALK